MNRILFALLASVFLICCGCKDGKRLDGHYPASGTVTLNGEPLNQGSIAFVPDAGSGGMGRSTSLKPGGTYIFKDLQALMPGEYTVQIESVRKYNLKTKADATPEMDDTEIGFESLVPPKYNKKSELKAVVTKEGANKFDFDLDRPK